MDGMIFPIIALAVAVGGYAVWQVVAALTDGEKRKLKQRLSSEGTTSSGQSPQQLSIVVQQQQGGSLSTQLVQFALFEGLREKLEQASPGLSLGRFVTICLGVGVGLFVIGIFVTESLLISAIAGVVGSYVPIMMLNSKRSRRQRLLADQLPESLDFLSRVLRAGHSLSTGLQMMGQELPMPLSGEFRQAYDEHSLGLSLEESLKNMTKRIESTDFAFFITAVLIQRQTGGDLSEVLTNISGMIRQRIRLQSSVKAKTAEGRFTGYILSAFPGIMFCIAYSLNPNYAGVLLRTTAGLELLGTAFGMQLLGLFFIQKITTVRV
jgi:tight adherence protein B